LVFEIIWFPHNVGIVSGYPAMTAVVNICEQHSQNIRRIERELDRIFRFFLSDSEISNGFQDEFYH